jgi:hypothetical protein
MQLEKLLAAVPAGQWETKQAIVFDWYDGPRSGICRLANLEGEFLFELLEERLNPEGLDDRLFRLREVPLGTMEKTLAVLGELGHPENAVWVPIWKFADPMNQQRAEQFLEEVEAKARLLPVVVASRDLKHFQGCWSTEKTNGDVTDWFSTLGAPLVPGL